MERRVLGIKSKVIKIYVTSNFFPSFVPFFGTLFLAKENIFAITFWLFAILGVCHFNCILKFKNDLIIYIVCVIEI